MWDTVIQALGTLVGAVGAYYAYRQFRSSRPATADSPSPTTDGVDTSLFRAAQSPTLEQIGAGIAGCLLAFVFLLFWDVNEPAGWIPAIMSAAIVTFVVWQLGPLDRPRHIELSETGLVVHIPAARFTPTTTASFAWHDIDSIAVKSTRDGRFLVIRLSSRHGLGSAAQQGAWDDRVKAFKICELGKVTPSDVALLSAITHYSKGRHQPSRWGRLVRHRQHLPLTRSDRRFR